MLGLMALNAMASEIARPCDVGDGLVTIRYIGHAEAAADAARRAAAEFREPEQVPAGGWLFVHVAHDTIEGAQPERFLVVAFDGAGGEIVRHEPPRWDSARIPREPGGAWTSDFGADVLVTPASFPLKVSVVDRPTTARCTWTVSEDGEAEIVENGVVQPGAAAPDEPPCTLPAIEHVEAGMTWIAINGQRRELVGRPNWVPFRDELVRCGHDDAAEALENWRTMRQTTNALAGCAFITAGITLLIAPIPAILADGWREELEASLGGAEGE